MELEPKTDREMMISMSSDMNSMSKSIERLAEAIEKLETNKIGSIEARITEVEKFVNQWGGVNKFLSILAIIVSVIAIVIKLK